MKKATMIVILVMVVAVLSLLPLWEKKNSKRTFNLIISRAALNTFIDVLMEQKGLVDKHVPEGVTVKWHNISSAAEQRDALISGAVDIAPIPSVALASTLQNNIPLVYLAYEGSTLYQLYAHDENIKTIKDLGANSKISCSSIGTGPHTAFLLAAVKESEDISRFKNSVIVMSNADAVNALISGTAGVDAVVCTFPTVVAAWNSDKVHLVRDLSDEVVEYGLGTLFCTRPDYLQKNPDIIEGFMKAHDEVVAFMKNNKAECARIMRTVYKDVPEETSYKMLDFYIRAIEHGLENYDKLMDFLYKNGILEQPAAKFADMPKYTRSGN